MRTVLADEQLDEILKNLFQLHQGKVNAMKRWDLVIKVFGEGSDIPRTDAKGISGISQCICKAGEIDRGSLTDNG